MTIQEFNKAMNGIDDRFLSAWEERQEKVNSFLSGEISMGKPWEQILWRSLG